MSSKKKKANTAVAPKSTGKRAAEDRDEEEHDADRPKPVHTMKFNDFVSEAYSETTKWDSQNHEERLRSLPGVGPKTASRMHKKGYTVEKLLFEWARVSHSHGANTAAAQKEFEGWLKEEFFAYEKNNGWELRSALQSKWDKLKMA